jgi:2'-5' RNA ligase
MEKKRIFVAIDISDYARERVASYIRSLQQKFSSVPVRWEKPEKLHITVKFVGSIDERQLASLENRVAAAASKLSPFEITIAGPGTFIKRSSRSNVVWLGLKSQSPSGLEKPIEDLAAAVDHEVGQSERRKFNPHLTIARFKDAKKARDLIEFHLSSTFEPVTFTVDEITIYESTLLPTGSVYNALSMHKLGAATR